MLAQLAIFLKLVLTGEGRLQTVPYGRIYSYEDYLRPLH
ncbi:hypothetical protein THERMOT_2065 [Bathymodiolus thermophilus thioautotrophic gill symbiont]|nr:hypothetical protein THERMOT_2065 [Bathymodiolus thermophilus thioautotrophic gill symbiont]